MEPDFTNQDAAQIAIQTDLNNDVNVLNHISKVRRHWRALGLVWSRLQFLLPVNLWACPPSFYQVHPLPFFLIVKGSWRFQPSLYRKRVFTFFPTGEQKSLISLSLDQLRPFAHSSTNHWAKRMCLCSLSWPIRAHICSQFYSSRPAAAW